MDKDHSGSVELTSFTTEENLRIGSRELSDEEEALAFFHIDKDRNGVIDLDEIIQFANEGKGWRGYNPETDEEEEERRRKKKKNHLHQLHKSHFLVRSVIVFYKKKNGILTIGAL